MIGQVHSFFLSAGQPSCRGGTPGRHPRARTTYGIEPADHFDQPADEPGRTALRTQQRPAAQLQPTAHVLGGVDQGIDFDDEKLFFNYSRSIKTCY